MPNDNTMDELFSQHVIGKIFYDTIIPCSCGGSRHIIQNKKTATLLTICQKCQTQSDFNMADLVILSSAFLQHAIGEDSDTRLKKPDITYATVWQMIQNHEDIIKTDQKINQRTKLKVIKGGVESRS